MSSHPPKSNKVLAPEGIRTLTHHLGIKKPFLCYTLKPHPVRKGEFKKIPWSQWEGTETKSALKKLDYWNACWQRVQSGEYSGVGIALFGGLIGFDFDHCLDEEDGELISTHPYALLIKKLMKAGAYMEVSPSGCGLHAFGWIEDGCPQEAYIRTDNSHTKIEVYVQGRFFTLTGNVWKGCEGLEPVNLTKFWMELNAERDEKRDRDRKPERVHQDLDDDELALRKRSVKRDLGKALKDIPPDDYHTWVACRHALIDFGLEFDCMDEARDIWLTWSSGSDSFRGDDVEGPKWDADVPKTEARGPEERRHYQWIFEEVKEHRGSSKSEDYEDEEDEEDEEEKGWPLETDCKPSRDKLAEWEALSATPIIASLLYPDIAQTVAPGGIGKTTFGLLLMIHIILGKAFCGHAIERPGPCVYVTREDSEGFMNSKLFKLMDDMSLSKKDQQRVCEGMRIVDVSALVNAKLVRAGKYGVLQVTDFADYIIEEFGPLEPSLVVFDPAMRFGPGESKVNDGEDMVVQTGVKIKAAMNCCVMFMHHTGKAQMGRTDQYAGRNGSAFSDGCRMVFVLGAYKWNAPNGWPCDPLKPGQSGLAIHRPKNSYVPGEECEPIYLVRTGFGFTQTLPLVRDAAEPQVNKEEREENELFELVVAHGPISRNQLRGQLNWPGVQVGAVIARLEEKELIERVGDKQSGGYAVKEG